MARDLARTPLFHITDVDNVVGIITSGGLRSDVALAQAGGPPVNIGYGHIKHRRMTQIRVPCAGNRFVGEFVPFYFCPRSPMLFVVNKGNTGRQPGCQKTILHLVTAIADAIQVGHAWAYSDGNAGAAYPGLYTDLDGIDSRLNWAAINENAHWGPVQTQKSAEFLVADHFPWGSIRAIGCMDNQIAEQVTHLLQPFAHKPPVLVRRGWYY